MEKKYLKERHNPQFKEPYYVGMGQLTKKDVKANEKPLYGDNNMLAFDTEDEYNKAIEKYKSEGFKVS